MKLDKKRYVTPFQVSARRHRKRFLEWVEVWHGDCDDCEIHEALQSHRDHQLPFYRLAQITEDQDDGAEESFSTFLQAPEKRKREKEAHKLDW